MKFAKLFDIDESTQVLVTRELEEEDKEAPYKLKVSTDYNGMYALITYGFQDEVKCDDAFDNYDLARATLFQSEIAKAIES